MKRIITLLFLFFILTGDLLNAKESKEELAKAVQNPLADIMSFPFQNNTNFNYGKYDRVQDVLNLFEKSVQLIGG